jgi:hypothetical protein
MLINHASENSLATRMNKGFTAIFHHIGTVANGQHTCVAMLIVLASAD